MYSGAQANSLYKTWELRVCGLAKTTMLCILVFSDEIFCTIYKLLRYVVIQPNTVNNTVSARRYIFLRNGDCCEEAKKSSTSLVRLLSSGLFNCIIWYCFVLDFIKVIRFALTCRGACNSRHWVTFPLAIHFASYGGGDCRCRIVICCRSLFVPRDLQGIKVKAMVHCQSQ